MGINGLWPILDAVSQRVDLTEYATDNGFLPKYNGTRTFHIGIDASVLLDSYNAAHFTKGRFFHHATSDPSLTQLFQLLSQLSNAPVDCTFVYDGDERPQLKRGKKVITEEPLLYRKSRALVEAYGFRCHTAKGDADAELAVMNCRGYIDAVLTKDSDVFPLGARFVLKIVPLECTATKVIVDVYDADRIANRLKLTTGGLILYSLLAGNDFDSGVENFGSVTALTVAQSSCGDLITTDCKRTANSPMQARFKNIKVEIVKRLMRSTDKRLANRARILSATEFPSQEALNWFLNAPTSWSGSSRAPDTAVWKPQGHNLAKIAKFCTEHIGWSAAKILKAFEQRVWRGVIIRILCSKYLMYDVTTGELLSPLLQGSLYRVNGGLPFAITNSTKIIGRNPPNLATKEPGDTVRITFDVSDLIRLTLLPVPTSCVLKESLSVFVPFSIIAAATGQRNLIPGLHRLGESVNTASFGAPAFMEDAASDDEVEITDFRPVFSLRIPVLDITSIDDVL